MRNPPVAFALGGGGILGAAEVGMLAALADAGIRPDLIVGTSIGAINGAFVAADPSPSAPARLAELWRDLGSGDVFGESLTRRIGTLARTRTHLHTMEPLRRLLSAHQSVQRIEDLAVPFQCVAASIERAAEHWFSSGPLSEAVLASCAVPGLFAPVEVGGEHFYDGGLVHSIPVGRAVALGARTVYVLHVGRIEQPLEPPTNPFDVGRVAFEIARRHRFAADLAELPPDVTVHVLPSGRRTGPPASRPTTRGATAVLTSLRGNRRDAVGRRIERAQEASAQYLAALPADRIG